MPDVKPQRIVVGLSGGVDSAVTAWLLKQQGHEVVGIFMKNWEDDDDSEYCSSNVDFVDAAAVADVLGIEIERHRQVAEALSQAADVFLVAHGLVRKVWRQHHERQDHHLLGLAMAPDVGKQISLHRPCAGPAVALEDVPAN